MSTEEERFAQLRQAGFVDVDKWEWHVGWPGAEVEQRQLLGVLRNDPQTTELRLGSCGIGDANAKVLAGHLKNNTHLTGLDLSYDKLSDVGVTSIAQALANHPTLKKLYLVGNRGTTDASCPALADLLRTLPTLETLCLSETSITDAGVTTLCAAATAHPAIKKLWLDKHEGITDASCAALADLLRASPTLELLDLINTRITTEGEAVLAAALGRTELDYLDIRPTAEERMRVARKYARWNEDQHYRTAGDFRRDLAEALSCLHEDEKAAIPWDDIRRVIQGWSIARFRLRWGGGKEGHK